MSPSEKNLFRGSASPNTNALGAKNTAAVRAVAPRPTRPPRSPSYPRAVLSPVTNSVSQAQALKHSTLHLPVDKDRLRHTAEGTEPDDEHLRSTVPSPVEQDDEDAVPPSLRVGLVAHRSAAGFASRANNLHAYLELNRFVRTPFSLLLPPLWSG